MTTRTFRFNVFLVKRDAEQGDVVLDCTNGVIPNQLDAIITAYLASDDWEPGKRPI